LNLLSTQVQAELIGKPGLKLGLFVVEPSSGRYLNFDAQRAYPAASMIKLPIFVKLLTAIDNKTVSFDQILVVRQDLIGGGSGWLQWRKPGTKVSLKEVVELMMMRSDNTATNMIIDVLGGKEACNRDFQIWGLSQTSICNPLPDLTGTNRTSPYDLAALLGKIDQGEILSSPTRAYMYSVMERNHTRTLLPMGIPPGTIIAHKTGDIGALVGDAGIVTCKNGQRYIVATACERPWNDLRANALIRQVSKDTYVAITGDAEGVKDLLIPPPPGQHPAAGHHRRYHRSHHRHHTVTTKKK
jgi:beta-lactamase class A